MLEYFKVPNIVTVKDSFNRQGTNQLINLKIGWFGVDLGTFEKQIQRVVRRFGHMRHAKVLLFALQR